MPKEKLTKQRAQEVIRQYQTWRKTKTAEHPDLDELNRALDVAAEALTAQIAVDQKVIADKIARLRDTNTVYANGKAYGAIRKRPHGGETYFVPYGEYIPDFAILRITQKLIQTFQK